MAKWFLWSMILVQILCNKQFFVTVYFKLENTFSSHFKWTLVQVIYKIDSNANTFKKRLDINTWFKCQKNIYIYLFSAFIVSLFSVGKSSALGCPFFSRELGRSSAPPRLGSSPCWGSEETEFAAIADEACERVWERYIFHRALDSGWREWTAGGRCIVCYIFWSSRKCFAGSSLPAM